MRLLTLLLLAVIPVAVAAVLSAPTGNPWALALTGGLFALASLVAGGLLGFLFGVPRYLTSERASGGGDPSRPACPTNALVTDIAGPSSGPAVKIDHPRRTRYPIKVAE
jgi:hypothetical protein